MTRVKMIDMGKSNRRRELGGNNNPFHYYDYCYFYLSLNNHSNINYMMFDRVAENGLYGSYIVNLSFK